MAGLALSAAVVLTGGEVPVRTVGGAGVASAVAAAAGAVHGGGAGGVAEAALARGLLPLLGVDTAATQRPLAVAGPHPHPEAARRAAPTPRAPAAPSRGRGAEGGGAEVAAIVLVVVEEAELLAVVGAAHEARGAARVAVVPPAVCRAVTVALPVLTRVFWSAAPPPVVVATPASLI